MALADGVSVGSWLLVELVEQSPPLAGLLRELIERPEWMDAAACRGRTDLVWFPETGQSAEPAKALCRSCPVRGACVAYAVDDATVHGVWGGLSRQERQRARTRAA